MKVIAILAGALVLAGCSITSGYHHDSVEEMRVAPEAAPHEGPVALYVSDDYPAWVWKAAPSGTHRLSELPEGLTLVARIDVQCRGVPIFSETLERAAKLGGTHLAFDRMHEHHDEDDDRWTRFYEMRVLRR